MKRLTPPPQQTNPIPLTKSPRKIKYLGKNNLTKYAQDPCPNNYKTLMKETKDQNKWRDKPYSSTRRLNIVTLISPNLIYRSDAFPSTYQQGVFCRYWQIQLKKFFLKSKNPQKARTARIILKNKKKVKELRDFKNYYKAEVIMRSGPGKKTDT